MSDEQYDYTPKPARGRKAKPTPAPAARRDEVAEMAPRPARRKESQPAGKPRLPARKPAAARPAKKVKVGSLLRSRAFMAGVGIVGLLVLVVVPVIAELTMAGSGASSSSPADQGDYYYNKALESWDAGDYSGALTSLQQAAESYQKALAANPRDAAVLSYLGMVYFYQNRLVGDSALLQQAIEAWNLALEYEPDRPETLFNLGLGYADLGEVDRAIELWQRVIELAPGSPAAESAAELIQEYSGAVGP